MRLAYLAHSDGGLRHPLPSQIWAPNKGEVTEDFSCPFCLAKCASYKGLRCHLTSSHDLFNFEFWVTEEYQAVNVSVKTDVWRSEKTFQCDQGWIEMVKRVGGSAMADLDPDSDPAIHACDPIPILSSPILMTPPHLGALYPSIWPWCFLSSMASLGEGSSFACFPLPPSLAVQGVDKFDLHLRNTDIVADGVDPRLQTFCYWSRPSRRRRSLNLMQNVNHVHAHAVKLDSPKVLRDISHASLTGKDKVITDAELPNGLNGGPSEKEDECSKAHCKFARYGSENTHSESTEQVFYNPGTIGICAASAQAPAADECNQPVSGGNNHATTAMLQFAKTRKLFVEKADPKNRVLLQKRQFFHSHRAQGWEPRIMSSVSHVENCDISTNLLMMIDMRFYLEILGDTWTTLSANPMALEQVLSDRDSEDEVDDDIADFEDRRMLDDFVDVTKDEKQIMHLWNSFVRKQRVLADGHIPWACEAFTKLHGHDFVREPALMWCWRLFMVKLWNHSLLDARTMNNCNMLLEKYQSEGSDLKQC
ncbi:hypothetical protein Taro_029404 [Colocasia esculenta]|uniref:Uncharacterized protein n=1 Tax=Colocasia esculenta TaxID=4460 RepID=A0A843VR10_COLES|nr:hypothetical protein [Colocasia esculenta]